jgi:4-hydroxymandelate oxidase
MGASEDQLTDISAEPLKDEPIPDLPLGEGVNERRVSIDDFEAAARRKLPKMAYDYYAGGAGDEWTLSENREAFGRWVFRPRVLVGVSTVSLETTVLGVPMPFPVILAPTAFQRLADREGELATARAAKALGVLMVLSTISTVPMEEVAATGVDRWFQLYVMKDRSLTAQLVSRAEVGGYGAIVLTVDTPHLGRRLRDERNSFALPPEIGMANLRDVPLPEHEDGSSLAKYFGSEHDESLTWDDLAWIRSLSSLPLVLKGIVTGEDARLAADHGVDGIIVSNHGGRQLDGAPATLDVLPEVADAVGGRCEILLDGGVRRGADVVKAVALGAKAVLIGRPYLWGLAAAGEAGVRAVLEMFRDELELAMALCGRRSISEIDGSAVAPAPGTVPTWAFRGGGGTGFRRAGFAPSGMRESE